MYGKPYSENRTPTFEFRSHKSITAEFADYCATNYVGVGASHFYAQGLCEQLEIMNDGCVIRVDCLYYNTIEEIDTLFDLIHGFLDSN